LNPLIQVLRHGHERITCNVAILCHKWLDKNSLRTTAI
jgi:hypothetical protein